MHDRLCYWWYEGAFWLSGAALTFASSIRTEGFQHVPRVGPALLVANHQSFLDPVLIGLAARRHLCFLARKTLFRNQAFTWLIGSLGAVPINQEGFARAGLETILEQLDAGRAVLVFPEGERTADGRIQPLRPGIHLLIKRVAMPIVPIGIAGAYHAWPRHQLLPMPAPLFLPPWEGTLAVSIGPPIDSRKLNGMPRQQILERLFAELQDRARRAEDLRRK